MSIRSILETALLAITPSIDTVFENGEYTPVEGTPYQRVFFLYAKPDNNYINSAYDQQGYMQINLTYPEMVGAAAIEVRTGLILAKFKAGLKLSDVHIPSTPEIGQGSNQDGRFVVPVFVNFLQHIGV